MNYGKIVRLTFNNKVFYVSPIEKTRFRLINIYGEYMYPVNVTYGLTDHEVYLHFTDINKFGANKLECFETIQMGSADIHIPAFVMKVGLDGLMPTDMSHIELSQFNFTGEIKGMTFLKAYLDDNTSYANLDSISFAGDILKVNFVEGYLEENTSYVNLNTITFSGQYCDINGVPL